LNLIKIAFLFFVISGGISFPFPFDCPTGESNRCAHQQGEAGTLPKEGTGDTGDIPLDRKHQIKALAVGRKHFALTRRCLGPRISVLYFNHSPSHTACLLKFQRLWRFFLLFGFPQFFSAHFFLLSHDLH
jgi:hypothetical protein